MPSTDDPSTVRALHRLVEHYTPDGVVGRSLFAAGAGGTATLGLFFVVAANAGPLGLLLVVAGVVGAAASIPLGLVVLWPVYLSLIGNVERAAAYPDGADETPGAPDPADSAEAVLKRRYAAGEIDHEEFAARLDRVIDYRDGRRDGGGVGGDADDGEGGGARGRERTRSTERAR